MIDPLHQFEIQRYFQLTLAGHDISFTNSSLFMVVSTVLISLIMYYGVSPRKMVPGRLQIVLEALYDFVAEIVSTSIGSKGRPYFPYVFTLFMFLAMGNLVGMIPYSFTFTSHIIVTFSMSVLVVVFVTVVGIVKHGFKFFSLFFPAGTPILLAPLLVPIEVISYLARTMSLSVRLFANMVAGHAMLKVFAGFVIILATTDYFPLAVLPLAVNVLLTGFKIFVALLQSYIFTILTCIYLSDSLNLH